MNKPEHWLEQGATREGPDVEVIVCRLDASTGKLAVGPAMADMVMGTASFRLSELEGKVVVCVNTESAMQEIDERAAAMNYEITEEEHRALTVEVMNNPAHWRGEVDDSPDDDVPRFSFYPFDGTTGRIRGS